MNLLLGKYESEPEMEYLNSIQKKMLNETNSFLKLEKDFKELKVREIKIRNEMKYLFTKPITLSRPKMYFHPKPANSRPRKLACLQIDICSADMDRYKEKEMMNKRPFTKNTCYDRLINHIP